jgi:hypothetical protein
MNELLSRHTVVVSGTVENQGRFYDRFEHVVLLSAPVQVLGVDRQVSSAPQLIEDRRLPRA